MVKDVKTEKSFGSCVQFDLSLGKVFQVNVAFMGDLKLTKEGRKDIFTVSGGLGLAGTVNGVVVKASVYANILWEVEAILPDSISKDNELAALKWLVGTYVEALKEKSSFKFFRKSYEFRRSRGISDIEAMKFAALDVNSKDAEVTAFRRSKDVGCDLKHNPHY